jgi:hypothetical protein
VSADLQGSQNRTSLSQNWEKQKKKLQIDQNLVLKFGRIKTGLDQLTRKTGWLAGMAGFPSYFLQGEKK